MPFRRARHIDVLVKLFRLGAIMSSLTIARGSRTPLTWKSYVVASLTGTIQHGVPLTRSCVL